MGRKERYERAKARLLSDEAICQDNRTLFHDFFQFEEYKLKRMNSLRQLDESCYKTLYSYILSFRNVNKWFANKPWTELTSADIKHVYDDLEDGVILNQKGVPFEDRASYYNKVFKSKPFRLAGKSELAKDVIEFSTNKKKDVRFVTEETFRDLVSVLNKPKHLLLFWLAWDIGENIDTLLQLTKSDFRRQENPHTREPEYLVHLAQHKLKRSRQSRSEPTLYPETVRYADMVLRDLSQTDPVFPFGYRQALKLLHASAKKTGATSMPNRQRVQWKDLRSGMASHLLKSGWTRDEVNARLGHVPHSNAIDAYINFLALDRDAPKRRLHSGQTQQLQSDLATARQQERLAHERLQRQETANEAMRTELLRTQLDVRRLREQVDQLIQSLIGKSVQSI